MDITSQQLASLEKQIAESFEQKQVAQKAFEAAKHVHHILEIRYSSLKKQYETQERKKELEKLKAPEVGQKFLFNVVGSCYSANIYILSKDDNGYRLVCIEGKGLGEHWHETVKEAENVFGHHKRGDFTLVK